MFIEDEKNNLRKKNQVKKRKNKVATLISLISQEDLACNYKMKFMNSRLNSSYFNILAPSNPFANENRSLGKTVQFTIPMMVRLSRTPDSRCLDSIQYSARLIRNANTKPVINTQKMPRIGHFIEEVRNYDKFQSIRLEI